MAPSGDRATSPLLINRRLPSRVPRITRMHTAHLLRRSLNSAGWCILRISFGRYRQTQYMNMKDVIAIPSLSLYISLLCAVNIRLLLIACWLSRCIASVCYVKNSWESNFFCFVLYLSFRTFFWTLNIFWCWNNWINSLRLYREMIIFTFHSNYIFFWFSKI